MAANKDTCSFVDVTPVADDAFTYKLALQHNLSDDVMVYGSYTTAIRAAGVNAGDNPTTYDPRKRFNFRLWFKKHPNGWRYAS